jgi:hypothetical protein
VQPGPLAGEQLGVQRLLGQGVAEGVGLGDGVGDEHLVGDGGPQRGQQVGLGQLADRGQQLVLHLAAGRGHDPQGRLGLVGEVLDAAQEHVLEARGQAAGGGVALVGGGQQLLGEERVALRAAPDLLGELVVGSGPEDAGQQVGDVVAVEAGHLEPLGPAAAVQLGQERPQGMAAVQLVGAVGQHQQQPGLEVADQEGEQVQGGAVGPVQVLHHQHGRGPAGQPLQQGQERLEQPGLARGADGGPGRGRFLAPLELGQQAGQQRPPRSDQLVQGRRLQLPAQPAHGLGHRRIGQRGLAELDAAAQQHLSAAPLDLLGEPGDQPGLADAGLAADAQGQQLAVAGVPERRLETAQLSCATDEPRARDGPGHGEEYALRPGRREPIGVRPAVLGHGSRPARRLRRRGGAAARPPARA